ncbi:leucine-rich repeat domain-containing protein [Microscilla marina]|uniref:leucine-rich repeat domain-containing protein n=1 Tax=Microscilla marina TaxID=1027 RepID=UPI0006A6F192|nr:leucine-rich repeat domain-containing protein [Microscilla marina]
MEHESSLLQLLQSNDLSHLKLAFELCKGLQGNYTPQVALVLQQYPLFCAMYALETDFCANLQELNLNNQQLEVLPPAIGQLKQLHSLWAWKNKLTKLPVEIGALTHLRVLSLQYNQLTCLPPEISRLTQLRDVYLYGNKISAEEKRKISQWLPNNCDIRFKRFED